MLTETSTNAESPPPPRGPGETARMLELPPRSPHHAKGAPAVTSGQEEVREDRIPSRTTCWVLCHDRAATVSAARLAPAGARRPGRHGRRPRPLVGRSRDGAVPGRLRAGHLAAAARRGCARAPGTADREHVGRT